MMTNISLRDEHEYESALMEIERYFENEPEPGTPDVDRFNMLARAIEDYESRHWRIDPPDAVSI